MDSKKPSGRSKFKDAFDRTIGRRFRRFSVRRASQYRRSSLPGAEQDGKSRRDSILGPRTYEKPVRMTHSAAHSLFLPSVKRLGSVADDARDDEIDFDDYEEFGSSRCIGFKRMVGDPIISLTLRCAIPFLFSALYSNNIRTCAHACTHIWVAFPVR